MHGGCFVCWSPYVLKAFVTSLSSVPLVETDNDKHTAFNCLIALCLRLRPSVHKTCCSAMAGILARTRQQYASSHRRLSVLSGHLSNIFSSDSRGSRKEDASANHSLPLMLACGSGAVGASAAAFSSHVSHL